MTWVSEESDSSFVAFHSHICIFCMINYFVFVNLMKLSREFSLTGKEVTYRLGGLNRARGEGVSTAAALGAEVRGGGGGVVNVGQNVMVSALLLCSVRVVTIGGRSACKWTICEQKEKEEYI